ncbi:hypothetical protein AB0H03_04320 [Streptomyces sparsogenes]|uniref:hypothetical protein n=1 Tax=Streptomyces sparsogenes TaxID=67365 RepID=UPI0033FAE30F
MTKQEDRRAAERARLRVAVARVVDAAPPLSVRQRERLRMIFRAQYRRQYRTADQEDDGEPDTTGHAR